MKMRRPVPGGGRRIFSNSVFGRTRNNRRTQALVAMSGRPEHPVIEGSGDAGRSDSSPVSLALADPARDARAHAYA
jgi:hypothetical protein